MMTVPLGNFPEGLEVRLPFDADFVSGTLTYQPGDWPTGTVLTLHLFDDGGNFITSWAATVSGSVAYWDIPAATVAPVSAANVTRARLHYSDSSGIDLLWAAGKVTNV